MLKVQHNRRQEELLRVAKAPTAKRTRVDDAEDDGSPAKAKAKAKPKGKKEAKPKAKGKTKGL